MNQRNSNSSSTTTNGENQNTEIAEMSPETQKKAADLLSKLGPLLLTLGSVFDTIEPYFEMVVDFFLSTWKKLEPYHPDELIESVFGLFLCFFGSHYLVTLAAVEAYKMCGWDQTYQYLKIIWADYCLVREESRKDDLIDADKDGVADVSVLSKQQLATRKLRLAAKACNPQKLSMALGGLYTGFMGVIATLRVQFAQTVTLGAVIGSTFSKYAQHIFVPILTRVVPSDYSKWIPVVIDYTCKTIGVTIAWFVQRIISSFYSAVRGAQMFSWGVLGYASRHGYIPTHTMDEGEWHYALLTIVVGGLGLLFQLSTMMALPFPFNVVFFPLTIVEYILQYFVAFE